MAKKVTGYIKLQIPAGKATPAYILRLISNLSIREYAYTLSNFPSIVNRFRPFRCFEHLLRDTDTKFISVRQGSRRCLPRRSGPDGRILQPCSA